MGKQPHPHLPVPSIPLSCSLITRAPQNLHFYKDRAAWGTRSLELRPDIEWKCTVSVELMRGTEPHLRFLYGNPAAPYWTNPGAIH